jgi:hypothetical protein
MLVVACHLLVVAGYWMQSAQRLGPSAQIDDLEISEICYPFVAILSAPYAFIPKSK